MIPFNSTSEGILAWIHDILKLAGGLEISLMPMTEGPEINLWNHLQWRHYIPTLFA